MIAAAIAIVAGELVTFKLSLADVDVRCGRVVFVHQLAGDVPGAWVVENGAAPQRTVHVAVVDLVVGCASPTRIGSTR